MTPPLLGTAGTEHRLLPWPVLGESYSFSRRCSSTPAVKTDAVQLGLTHICSPLKCWGVKPKSHAYKHSLSQVVSFYNNSGNFSSLFAITVCYIHSDLFFREIWHLFILSFWILGAFLKAVLCFTLFSNCTSAFRILNAALLFLVSRQFYFFLASLFLQCLCCSHPAPSPQGSVFISHRQHAAIKFSFEPDYKVWDRWCMSQFFVG